MYRRYTSVCTLPKGARADDSDRTWGPAILHSMSSYSSRHCDDVVERTEWNSRHYGDTYGTRCVVWSAYWLLHSHAELILSWPVPLSGSVQWYQQIPRLSYVLFTWVAIFVDFPHLFCFSEFSIAVMEVMSAEFRLGPLCDLAVITDSDEESIYNFPKVCVSACRHRQSVTCAHVPIHCGP